MNNKKTTLVLGASTNPSRYSFLAINQLRQNGHPVLALGLKEGQVNDVNIQIGKPHFDEVDTVTVYLGEKNQHEFLDYILSLHPKRIIFNPGAENDEFAKTASDAGIQVMN